jgi:hypothetical protein
MWLGGTYKQSTIIYTLILNRSLLINLNSTVSICKTASDFLWQYILIMFILIK